MTQNEQILNHLRSQPITPIEALNLYGVFRLAARVRELRKEGHDIVTENIPIEGKRRYARYRLRKH